MLRYIINSFSYRTRGRWIWHASIPQDGRILFSERDRSDFGFLSNMAELHPVEIDGVVWPTTEHFYQAQKVVNENRKAYQRAILAQTVPKVAKHIGSNRKQYSKYGVEGWFKNQPEDLRSDWDVAKLEVMRKALEAKFTQVDVYRRALLATGDAEIIEDSPGDAFWGWGKADQQGNHHGQNQMGKLLMKLRKELRSRWEHI